MWSPVLNVFDPAKTAMKLAYEKMGIDYDSLEATELGTEKDKED